VAYDVSGVTSDPTYAFAHDESSQIDEFPVRQLLKLPRRVIQSGMARRIIELSRKSENSQADVVRRRCISAGAYDSAHNSLKAYT